MSTNEPTPNPELVAPATAQEPDEAMATVEPKASATAGARGYQGGTVDDDAVGAETSEARRLRAFDAAQAEEDAAAQQKKGLTTATDNSESLKTGFKTASGADDDAKVSGDGSRCSLRVCRRWFLPENRKILNKACDQVIMHALKHGWDRLHVNIPGLNCKRLEAQFTNAVQARIAALSQVDPKHDKTLLKMAAALGESGIQTDIKDFLKTMKVGSVRDEQKAEIEQKKAQEKAARKSQKCKAFDKAADPQTGATPATTPSAAAAPSHKPPSSRKNGRHAMV